MTWYACRVDGVDGVDGVDDDLTGPHFILRVVIGGTVESNWRKEGHGRSRD